MRPIRFIMAERSAVGGRVFEEGGTVMRGPVILARSMSLATRRGKRLEEWQYHSRSDAHSKLACWTLLFDLLGECDVLRSAAEAGPVLQCPLCLSCSKIAVTMSARSRWPSRPRPA